MTLLSIFTAVLIITSFTLIFTATENAKYERYKIEHSIPEPDWRIPETEKQTKRRLKRDSIRQHRKSNKKHEKSTESIY